MCVRIRHASAVTLPYDADLGIITVPTGLSPDRNLIAIRTVLDELGVKQGSHGAVCWCGAAVQLGTLIPGQQSTEAINVGS